MPMPDRLGDYRIVREIGRGGMGIVYEADHEALGRRVAVKVLPGIADERTRERFRREAKAAARLHHTNIVPVFGVGEDGGYHYYVMQLIRGQGLDEVLRELRHLRDRARAGGGDPGGSEGGGPAATENSPAPPLTPAGRSLPPHPPVDAHPGGPGRRRLRPVRGRLAGRRTAPDRRLPGRGPRARPA